MISSETKVLREVVSNETNIKDIPEILMFGTTGDERTGIKNLKRCLPGKVYIYDLNKKKLEIKITQKINLENH